MKTKIFLSLLVMAALCILPSCSDDEDEVLNEDSWSETENPDGSNPDESNPDENTGDEDEDEPDGDDTDDDDTDDDDEETDPLVNGRIVIDGADFTGYTSGTTDEDLYPWEKSIFDDEEMTAADALPETILVKHTGHAIAWLRSNAADIKAADTPATLTISKTDNNRYKFKAEAYRWALDYDSENWIDNAKNNPPEMTIKANADKTVYYFNNGSSDEYYTEQQVPDWGSTEYAPNFDQYTQEDVTKGYRVTGFEGKISADGTKYEFLIHNYNTGSGTNIFMRSGDPSPAEAMSGHYHGTLAFSNKWLSGTATEQGGTVNCFNDRPDMYALIKPDADGNLRLDIMGFDIGRNEFGNLNFTGITDVKSKGNWAYDFELDNFEIQVPINDKMGTVTGSLEGEMSATGALTVYITAKFPSIGDTTIAFTGTFADWLNSGWNTYYGGTENRPW